MYQKEDEIHNTKLREISKSLYDAQVYDAQAYHPMSEVNPDSDY